MSSSFERDQKRRLISSYFSVVLSIALVLFLLGLLGMLVLNAKKVSDHFKEQVVVTIYLKETAKEVEIKQLEKSLAMADYVKSIEYVTKEQAAEFLKAENGEDFMDFVGYNPLQNSIDVHLKADFVTSEHLEKISEEATSKNFVDEVNYDQLYFYRNCCFINKQFHSLSGLLQAIHNKNHANGRSNKTIYTPPICLEKRSFRHHWRCDSLNRHGHSVVLHQQNIP